VPTEPTRRTFLKASAMGLTAAATADLASAFTAPAVASPSGDITVRVTSGKLRYEPAPSLTWGSGGASDENVISVDSAQKFQEILGFGAAFTDSACYMFNRLEPSAREQLFHELFHPSQMALSVCRTCIGSSDYATEVFSYDEGHPDPDLKRFSIAHDEPYVLPILRLARKENPDLFLFSTPWSPPGWMKAGGSMLGGCMRPRFLGAYSRYFLKFLQAYADGGVPIQAVTVQNEVDTDQDGRMPACSWTQEYEIRFVRDHLGPLLHKSGLSTKIWILDHNYNLWGRAAAELDDPELRKYCDGVAFHGYAGTPDMMTKLHNMHPDTALLDRRRTRLQRSGLSDGLGELGQDLHGVDSKLVPVHQRLEPCSRRKRTPQYRAVSLRRHDHDSFADPRSHAQRTVLGVFALFSCDSPRRSQM